MRAGGARRALVFQLAVRATGALHTVVFHPAVRAGCALRALVFPLPVRAPYAVHAVVFHFAVGAGGALCAGVFHLAVGTPVTLIALVILPPMRASISSRHYSPPRALKSALREP